MLCAVTHTHGTRTAPFGTYLRVYVYARNLHLLLREEASARSARFRYVPMFRRAALQRKNKRTDARRAAYSSRSLFLLLSFFFFLPRILSLYALRCAAFFPPRDASAVGGLFSIGVNVDSFHTRARHGKPVFFFFFRVRVCDEYLLLVVLIGRRPVAFL